jgi:hypothetical protein
MEKVTGIGGIFFRAKDPKALRHWYQQHLGVTVTPANYEQLGWQQEAGRLRAIPRRHVVLWPSGTSLDDQLSGAKPS